MLDHCIPTCMNKYKRAQNTHLQIHIYKGAHILRPLEHVYNASLQCSACVYACMGTFLRVCIYTCIYVYTHTHTLTRTDKGGCSLSCATFLSELLLCVCMHIRLHTHIRTYIHMVQVGLHLCTVFVRCPALHVLTYVDS